MTTTPVTPTPHGARAIATRAGRRLLDLLAGPHGIDRYVELLDPRLASDRHHVEVRRVVHETTDTVTLHLDPPRGWRDGTLVRPQPGQAVTLTVEVDGVRQRRSFSVASLRTDTWTVTIRANPDGTVSRHLVEHAVPGLLLEVGPAFGAMTLPADRGVDADLLLVSGGSGITPVMALLRQLEQEGRLVRPEDATALAPSLLPRVAFLHYARTPDQTIFAAELASLARRYTNLDLVVAHTGDTTSPDSAHHRLTGRFEPAHLDALDVDVATARSYLCGPAGLVDSVRDAVVAAGGDDPVVELFHPPTAPVADGDVVAGTVTFADGGTTAEADGSSLLAQAEGTGLRPVHGCRMGICHSCTTPVTAGSVRDLLTGAVRTATAAAPVETQLCISAAHGDCTVAC